MASNHPIEAEVIETDTTDTSNMELNTGTTVNMEDISKEDMELLKELKELRLKKKKIGKEALLKLLDDGDDSDEEDKFEDAKWNTVKQEMTEESVVVKKIDKEKGKTPLETTTQPTGLKNYSFPKLSKLFGEEGKGEVTWQSYKFEVEALLVEKIFKEEQILFGMRRSLMGKAGDKYRRIGTNTTVRRVLDKLESEYGMTDTKETICRKFYASKQEEKETLADYTARVEEAYTQAIKLKGIQPDDNTLKSVMYEGLRKDLRHLTTYKYETVEDVDKFKMELRKIDNELKSEKSETRKCNAAVVDQSKGELGDIKKLLEQLNSRIDKLEKEKESNQTNYQNQVYIPRGMRRGQRPMRGYPGTRFSTRNRGSGRGGDRGETRPSGPYDYTPTCWWCSERGHVQRDCPMVPTCWKCNQKGHLQRDCPKE